MIEDFNRIRGGASARTALRARDIAAFRGYWTKMRQGGMVPRRADIDPRGIEPLLAEAFVAERIAPGLARLRIAGNHLTDLMGMEVRGMPLSSFILPEHRDGLADLLVDLFDAPALLDLELTSKGAGRGGALTGRMVLMPLRSDLGDVSRALGCLVTEGPLGREPHRFAITRSSVKPIAQAAAQQPGPEVSADEAAPLAGERPYLRLVR